MGGSTPTRLSFKQTAMRLSRSLSQTRGLSVAVLTLSWSTALLPLLALVPALVSGAVKKANALDVEVDVRFPSHNAFASKSKVSMCGTVDDSKAGLAGKWRKEPPGGRGV